MLIFFLSFIIQENLLKISWYCVLKMYNFDSYDFSRFYEGNFYLFFGLRKCRPQFTTKTFESLQNWSIEVLLHEKHESWLNFMITTVLTRKPNHLTWPLAFHLHNLCSVVLLNVSNSQFIISLLLYSK